VATGHLHASGDKLPIPLWVVLAAHTAIALGTISGGWRVVQTMGQRITELRPARGMAAETGAAVALFGSTALGAPVSTTHTVAGAVTGVGTVTRGVPVKRWSATNW
jgi:PiT family inorganic phosphate transporter